MVPAEPSDGSGSQEHQQLLFYERKLMVLAEPHYGSRLAQLHVIYSSIFAAILQQARSWQTLSVTRHMGRPF